MLRKLIVDNFKSLCDFEMDINPLAVIVGNNSAGKSTVLQLLDLLCSCVKEDFDNIIMRRNWSVADIRSKCYAKASSTLSIESEYEIHVGDHTQKIRWKMDLKYNIQKNSISLISENIYDPDDDSVYLEYGTKGASLYTASNEVISYPHIPGASSMLKLLIDVEKDKKIYPVLTGLKRFLLGVRSFELLSPDQMRASSRGKSFALSMSGRNLPSFLKNMSETEHRHFVDTLRKLLGGKIEDVSTETQGKPGWTYVNITERYQDQRYTISSRQLSDGILRLLAFIGLSESRDGELMLLDEIENGINNGYAESIMDIFYSVSKAGRQLLMTTHSVAFLDYVNIDDIVYLYRDLADGRTVAVKLSQIPEVRENLEYMYPGEVLYNMTNQQIAELCMKRSK